MVHVPHSFYSYISDQSMSVGHLDGCKGRPTPRQGKQSFHDMVHVGCNVTHPSHAPRHRPPLKLRTPHPHHILRVPLETATPLDRSSPLLLTLSTRESGNTVELTLATIAGR